jgi:hypothetical protein
VTLLGPASQRSTSETAKGFIVSSGRVTLDIRPLSAYQQQLIDRILSLRSCGWSDRQIANYFNETGYLTPRGCRWIPHSVFSIRKQWQAKMERLGEGW